MSDNTTIAVCVVSVCIVVLGSILGIHYINKDKPHVFSAQEIFVTECSKRGGNPLVEDGKDYEGDRSVDIKNYKCEGVDDVRN